MCTHVDHTEHDLDVLVTEQVRVIAPATSPPNQKQGLADLRGLCPRDRAQVIIKNCAHPDYRPILQEYYDLSLRACLKNNSAHEPHMLFHVFDMHKYLVEKGTMKIPKWEV